MHLLRWGLLCLLVDAALLLTYARYWRRRRDVAAFVYVHKGAIWLVWLTTWISLLAYLAFGGGPVTLTLIPTGTTLIELARTSLALLGLLLVIYLAYLVVIYPLFASLRPAISRQHLGFDWQLDIYVEDKVSNLVEENPTTPLVLLHMGLAEVLQEKPTAERLDLLGNLWTHYIQLVTGDRACGVTHRPPAELDFVEPDLNRTIRLALENLKITDNHGESNRTHNVVAMPLLAGGVPLIVFAASWPRHRPFAGLYSLVAQQFGIMRGQYIMAMKVTGERLAYYDNPWNDFGEV